MIETTLIWYELHISILKEMGFELNPDDMYVANKHINVKQCTVTWYMYDNSVSHENQNVINGIIQKIEDMFPGLTVSKGDDHTFTRIQLRYLRNNQGVRDGKVCTNMKAYIMEVAEEFGEDATKMVTSPRSR